jgi:hypothetical protein
MAPTKNAGRMSGHALGVPKTLHINELRQPERCGRESNPRIAVLQTAALPLGYRTRAFKLSTATGFLKTTRRITPDIGSRLE